MKFFITYHKDICSHVMSICINVSLQSKVTSSQVEQCILLGVDLCEVNFFISITARYIYIKDEKLPQETFVFFRLSWVLISCS